MVLNLWEWSGTVDFNSSLHALLTKRGRKINKFNKLTGLRLVTLLSTFSHDNPLTHAQAWPSANHLQNKTTMTTMPQTMPPNTPLLGNVAATGRSSHPSQKGNCSRPSFRGHPPDPPAYLFWILRHAKQKVLTLAAAPKMQIPPINTPVPTMLPLLSLLLMPEPCRYIPPPSATTAQDPLPLTKCKFASVCTYSPTVTTNAPHLCRWLL